MWYAIISMFTVQFRNPLSANAILLTSNAAALRIG
jgi:hypothetical protein